MTKLASMIGKPEEVVAATIAKLEGKAGYSSEDVRLLAQTSQEVKTKIAQLGLDPDDTTGEELNYTLQSKYDQDSKRLEAAAGLAADSSLDAKLDKAIELVGHISEGDEVWAVKPVVAKNLLQSMPPKKLVKQLGYRSTASCVKRQDAMALLAAGFLTEAPTWRKLMSTKLAHLSQNDFELRLVRLVKLPKAWTKIMRGRLLISDALAGVVAFVPGDEAGIPLLSIVLLALDELEKISLRSIHKPVSVINPTLKWWHGAEHLLAWNDGEPVSLNFKDNAISHLQNLAYEDRSTKHAGESLWQSLVDRYQEKIGELPEELIATEKKIGHAVVPEPVLEFEEAEI